MTDLVERRADSEADPKPEPNADPKSESGAEPKPDVQPVAAEIRARVERVRRRELDDALGRLEARGEVTPEQRRVVAALSVGIAGALVDRWTGALGDDAVDPAVGRDLLVE